MRITPSRLVLLLSATVVLACQQAGSNGGSGGGSGSGEDGTGTEGSDDDGDGGASDGGGDDGNEPKPDVDGPAIECSLYAQDCPADARCIPTEAGGSRCVPIDADPKQAGEPCSLDDGMIDDCDLGLVCHGVDTESLRGTCVPMCGGSQSMPVCDDADAACVQAEQGLPLCLSSCQPLVQDCPGGWGCYPLQSQFFCSPDGSGTGGAYADSCVRSSSCNPGFICAAEAVPGCDDTSSCCTALCDGSDMGASAGCDGADQGQQCLAFFPAGGAPPGLEDVGVCAIP